MAKKEFCSVDNYSVLIPYKDLEKLVTMAQNYEEVLKVLKHLEEQCAALRYQYVETLDKLRELEDML